jgi:hypothetical protein
VSASWAACSFSFIAQADDDDGFRPRKNTATLQIWPGVQEYLVRAYRRRIKANFKRATHGAADEIVHDKLSASQSRRSVMTNQEWLWLECEVAVDNRDSQRWRFRRSSGTGSRRFRNWDVGDARRLDGRKLPCCAAQQATVGQIPAWIDAVQRLLSSREGVN